MSINTKDNIPNTAFVVFNHGAFGGAAKRETSLFLYLNKLYPGKFYFFINRHLYNQIHEIFEDLPEDRIKIVDLEKDIIKENKLTGTPRFYADNIPDPMEVDKQHSFVRKIYWFYKNKNRQRRLFRQIENLRSSLDIKVFYGVFAGILPLVFYLKETQRKAAVIYSDMDSWFSEIHSDIKKLWYRKYYSFNYSLEKCDIIDFLSPYIYEGVKKLGVKINENSVHISPCSFIDYSKCSLSEKKSARDGFEIAFCGRLEPDKNPMLYLEAAREILNKYPGVKFHILGEGTLVKEIKSFIDTNNLNSSINFCFHKSPPEIFKETSVFVSLQSHTNYPSQSVLEAMACGNAVIASNRGDTNLFINNSNGILVELNKNEIVSAMGKLINNPSVAHGMGRKGSEEVKKNHTIEKFTEYFLELLSRAYLKVFS